MPRFLAALLKPKNAISVAVKVSKIVQKLKDELKDYNFKESKTEPSLIEYIGRLVEAEFQKKKVIDSKVNKREILLQILEKLCDIQLTEQDKNTIIPIIEHLHSTNRFKLVSNSRVFKSLLFNFFAKKE